ncbi:MAG: lipopolysaccharide transport system ATP-binding protein [Parvicella sp.]|jgi:lipopolysaccharide transport system ATP-binding protein
MSISTDQHITKSTTPEAEVLVRVEGVSKKFCKDLKRSLWYGIQDITSELFGLKKKEGLRKDEFWAVSEVSFELKRGECLGLIGHNGAGKSTLLKILNGLIKPDQGKITMKGRIAALIELGAGFNPILTGRENVFNNAAVLGFTQEETLAKYQDIVEFAELDEYMDTPVQNYSSGMKIRLGFAVASQMEPDVLIIDEVLAVGDTGFKVKCLNRITELLNRCAVVFVSHSMPFVLRICTDGLLLVHGKVIAASMNVANVVNQYHSQFDTGMKNVLSTGQIKLLSIHILDTKLNPKKSLSSGDEFLIKIKLKTSTKLEKINVIVRVWNIEQRPLLDLTSKENKPFTFTTNKELISLQVNVKSLNLSAGKYSFSIHISDQDMKVILKATNVITLNIKDDYSTTADLYQPCVWSLNPLNPLESF